MADADVASLGLGTFVVACTCATLGLMVSVCFLIFHIYHRENKVVKMSSPYLNIVSSIGAIILSVVCFLYGLDFILGEMMTSLTVICQVRIWLLVLAITLVYCPVATKSWRVYEIFKYGCAKKVVIRDRRLFFILLGVLLVDCTLMSLWQTIDPATTHTATNTERVINNENGSLSLNRSYSIHICTCSKFEIWATAITLWKTTNIISCLYFAWKIRNVAVPGLNDSSHTIAAIFLNILLMFCVSMTSTALRSNQDAVYILTTLTISACAIIVQMILFLPKVRYWWNTPDNVSPRISSASLKGLPWQHNADVNGNTFQDECLVDIVEENKQLKESLFEKEDLIAKLQSHLDNAKEKVHMLPKELEMKPDSGLDLGDTSSASNDDIYDTLRSPDHPSDRSKLYQVDGTETSKSDDQETHYIDDDDHPRHKTSLKYSHSFQSGSSRRSFVLEFTDLRDSIAHELDSASCIQSGLQQSLYRDMERSYSETEWLYESTETQELAGSIAQSYNLGETPDALSYINPYLPYENRVVQIKKARRMSGSSVMSYPSSETMSERSVNIDNNISRDFPSMPRDSETPNSQQHAAILRYYSYRHMNSGQNNSNKLNTKNANKFHKTIPPSTFKPKPSDMSVVTLAENKGLSRTPSAIYSVPLKKPRILARASEPSDSFV